MSSPRSPIRSLVLLVLVGLTVPLLALVGAAPAQAAPSTITVTVTDALDAPLSDVTVQARNLITNADVGAPATPTAEPGSYALSLEPGDYRVWFSKDGYTSEPYGGAEDPITVTVAADGSLVLDGDPQGPEDRDLGVFTLQATAKRAVTGTVTAGGSAYPNVTVRAFAEDDDEVVVASDLTDAGGVYTLDLPLGRYYVELVAPIATPQYANTFVGGATPTPVVVAAGDGPLTLDTIALAPAVGASFPIAGRVVDANGEPLNGITVAVSPISPSTDTDSTVTDGTENTAGSYSASVKAGSYQVTFSATNFVTTTFPGAGLAPSTVTIAANGSLSVNGTPTETGRLEDLEIPSTGRNINGRVTTTGGTGLSGITVRATAVGSDAAPVTALSGANGVYTLPVPIGRWTVDLTDADGVEPQYAGDQVASGKVLRVDQDGTFALDGAAVSELPTQALATASADKPYDVLGDLADVNGDPVPGVQVTATGGATPVTATSNAAGRYSLPLKAGTYRIRTTATAAFGATDFTNDTAAAVDVVVAANGAVTIATVEVPGRLLRPITLGGLQTTNVTGRAVAGGAPIAGITAKGLLTFDTSVVGGTSAQTVAPAGTYTLPLKIGTYVVELSDTNGTAPTYSKVYVGNTTDVELATEVKVAQGGVVSVNGTVLTSGLPDTTMTPADATTVYDVKGTVSDVNGDPLAGATVTATGRPSVTTDNEGGYTLKLVQGSYQVTFAKGDFVTRSYPAEDDDEVLGTVSVALDGTISVSRTEGGPLVVSDLGDIELTGTATHPLSGTVRGAGGVDPGVITVQVSDDNAGTAFADATKTSGSGAYNLGLKVGTYKLQFVDDDPSAPLYARTGYPQLVKVATNGAIFLDSETLVTSLPSIELPIVPADAKYFLVGTTTDWDGNSLNGVLVEAIDPATGAVRYSTTTRSDPPGNSSLGDGVYRMEVGAGSYWLRFSLAGLETTYLTSFEDPRIRLVVTVTPDGRISAPEEDTVDTDNVITDVSLYFPAPKAKSQPGLKGKPIAGQTVTANLGTWEGVDLKEWATVEWFLDGKGADKYSSGKLDEVFTIPATAVGQKLTFDLTLDDPDFKKASVYFTSQAVAVKALKPKVKSTYKKGLLTVKVKAKGVKKLTGKIAVLDGKKKIAKGALTAKSKGGVVIIKLPKLKPGKHKLTVVFSGGKGMKVIKDKLKVVIR